MPDELLHNWNAHERGKYLPDEPRPLCRAMPRGISSDRADGQLRLRHHPPAAFGDNAFKPVKGCAIYGISALPGFQIGRPASVPLRVGPFCEHLVVGLD